MDEYFEAVKNTISKKVGIESSEIELDSYFEDDLNIGEMELLEILEDLEEKYQIDLTEEKYQIEVVSDLVDLISEKLE